MKAKIRSGETRPLLAEKDWPSQHDEFRGVFQNVFCASIREYWDTGMANDIRARRRVALCVNHSPNCVDQVQDWEDIRNDSCARRPGPHRPIHPRGWPFIDGLGAIVGLGCCCATKKEGNSEEAKETRAGFGQMGHRVDGLLCRRLFSRCRLAATKSNRRVFLDVQDSIEPWLLPDEAVEGRGAPCRYNLSTSRFALHSAREEPWMERLAGVGVIGQFGGRAESIESGRV